MLRNVGLFGFLLAVRAVFAASPCASAPGSYAAVCAELDRHLSSFEATLGPPGKVADTPVAFSTELLSANANRGLGRLLSPRTMPAVRRELDGLSKVGVQAVTIAVGFPILYRSFHHNPADFQRILDFYKRVMAEVRRRGLKVVIETSVMFPGHATDLPLNEYYAGLSEAQLVSGRAQAAQTIAQELAPDWLNLGSEPDTQSALLRMPGGYSAEQYGSVISTIMGQLRKANVSGKPLIGAGIGTWHHNGRAYVQALIGTGVDYIDLHIFSANLDFMNNALKYIDMAHAAGKGCAISEAWLKKLSDAQVRGKSEFGIIKLLSEAKVHDPFSFWAPLDSRFIDDLVKLARWKELYYLSPYPSPLMFAYLDYDRTRNMGAKERQMRLTAASIDSLERGALSPTGQAYSAAIHGR